MPSTHHTRHGIVVVFECDDPCCSCSRVLFVCARVASAFEGLLQAPFPAGGWLVSFLECL